MGRVKKMSILDKTYEEICREAEWDEIERQCESEGVY